MFTRKSDTMKFSFIIPSKNEEKYIENCIRSIKKQTKKNYEIIVVDSGSDNTKKIANKLGVVVLTEKRKGPGAARNTGASKAKGDILIFMDADVRIEKDFIEKVEPHFSKNISGGVCKLSVYDSTTPMNRFFYKRMVNHIAFLMIKLGMIMTTGSLFIYSKKAFERAGGFNINFMTNEDHELARRASKFGRFVFFNDVHVTTSARRVNRMGLGSAIKMYIKSTLFLYKGKYLQDYWD